MDGRIVVVGGGVMGGALLRAVRSAGWPAERVLLVEPDRRRATALATEHEVSHTDALAEAVPGARAVVLAVKPGVVPAVLVELAQHLEPTTLIISVAAGVSLDTYEHLLPPGTPVVRVMPNTPAVIGKGAAAITAGTGATDDHLDLVERLLSGTGLVVRVAEKDLDAVTAISGSGPAYAFYLIDAMAEAGVLLGLTRDLATRLAAATVEGAGALAVATGDHPAVLRERVSSPGGTTVAAVAELDAHAVRGAVVAAARAASDRSIELGRPGPTG